LIMYSDGVTDCNNSGDELFNMNCLREFLERHRIEPLSEVLSKLRTALVVWHGSEQFDDDISVLGMQIL
jgi:phosphoserine phosphatase RsbU/P